MKSLLANLRPTLFFLFLGLWLTGCAQKKVKPLPLRQVSRSAHELSDDELKLEESKDPFNAALRFEVSKRQWCGQEASLAIQNWLWIKQFKKEGLERTEALECLDLLKRDKKSEISARLGCTKN